MRGIAAPERAASHVGQRQFHCGKPPPAAEPRIRTFTPDRSTGLDVAVTSAQPAEVEADVLAVAADGALARELDERLAGADPVTLAYLDRGLVAAGAVHTPDAQSFRTPAAPAGGAARGGPGGWG